MKILLANLVLIFAGLTIFGQVTSENSAVCTNETVEKISSRGIKLGMKQEEVLKLFTENGILTAVNYEYLQNEGRSKVSFVERDYQSINNSLQTRASAVFGFSATVLAPKDKIKFDGISHYDLGFLDNRLTFFRVYYTKPQWKDQQQFIRKLSEILNLPIKEDLLNSNSYKLKCGDYEVGFEIKYNDEARYAMLVSANSDEIIQQRRKKADDEQREKDIKIFKP